MPSPRMRRRAIVSGVLALAAVGIPVVFAAPAMAATSSRGGVSVTVPGARTSYNHQSVRVHPRITVKAGVRRQVTSHQITAFSGTRRIAKSGSDLWLKPGRYAVQIRVNYRTYRWVTKNVRTWKAADEPARSRCVVKAVDESGFITWGDCTNPAYPGQHAIDTEGLVDNDVFYPYSVGDVYVDSLVDFKGQYVTHPAKVKSYTGRGHFVTRNMPVTVRDGGWRRIWSGSGIQTTGYFTPPGSSWKISYSFDCSDFGYRGNFIVTVYRNGEYYDLAANRLAWSGTGTSYVHGSGRFYLEMNSECDWSVTAR